MALTNHFLLPNLHKVITLNSINFETKLIMKKQLLLLIMLAILAYSANATKWRVNNTPGIDADFTTFKEAHDGASTGDTIYFEGSPTYYGSNDTVYRQLVIIGPGYFLNENDSTQANIVSAKLNDVVFMSGSEGSIISGMYINGNIHIGTNNITIERNFINEHLCLCASDENNDEYNIANCIIKQNYLKEGTYASSENTALNILFYNNIAERIILNDESSATIENNTLITTTFLEGIRAYNSTIRNNVLYGRVYTGTANLIENNLEYITGSEVYLLTGSSDGRYKLKEGSPAIGAGYDGEDCGAFGGNQPYVISGIPAGPHIFEADVSTSGSAGSGLPVILKIKTQN